MKASSTSTKVRVVFDGSAKSSSGMSLNDMLEAGPTLNPTLLDVLLRFRTFRVAVSADIQKMYREIMLHPEDRHLHRFLWRPKQVGPIGTYAMNRVTFGVTSSPFLAIRTLFKIVEDFGESAPLASSHVKDSMYVDNLLAGGDTEEEVIDLFHQMRGLLKHGHFNIVKWRSSSSTVLDQIPADICEHEVTKQDLVDRKDAKHPKALGLIWDSSEDVMATQIEMVSKFATTKMGVISDVSRIFDVLGWLAPAIVPMKLVFQKLWLEKIGWDDQVPQPYKLQHERWREELPPLSQVKLKRCYFAPEKTVSVSLHGFCDASKLEYSLLYSLEPPIVTEHQPVLWSSPRTRWHL